MVRSFIEKIQYALIYMLYKGKAYRSGRGYIYRANQMLSITFSSVVTFSELLFAGLPKTKEHASISFIIFLGIYVCFFIVLECNVTHTKILQNRLVFKNYKTYIKYFYLSAFLFSLFLFALYMYVVNTK
jgi:hypothetical protein